MKEVTKYRKLSDLHKLENNPRFIKDEDFEKLCKSIKNNPDYFEARPILLSDRTGKLIIIAGNQRFEAAKHLGLKEVPTFLMKGLSEEREHEIIIRDNVNNGEWDHDLLANEWNIEYLNEWGLDLSFIPAAESDENDRKKDLSSSIKEEFKLEITLNSEKEQELLFIRLSDEGYKCKVLNL